jgi:hypothetical protein
MNKLDSKILNQNTFLQKFYGDDSDHNNSKNIIDPQHNNITHHVTMVEHKLETQLYEIEGNNPIRKSLDKSIFYFMVTLYLFYLSSNIYKALLYRIETL